jgi:LAO/AO transport system kinase
MSNSPTPRARHEGCPQPRPDWVPVDAGPGFATWILEGVHPAGGGGPARSPVRRREWTDDELVAGVLRRDPTLLARAITIIESNAPRWQERAQRLLARLQPHAGGARRVGITGIPGAGKSTFIENLGMRLIEQGHQVAVLAVDPSSSVHGGSILADKVRMERLAARPEAFIRPSPSGGALGGVARKTREAMLLCEAAGYDVVLVETVGVGQNEVTVRSMVDFFLVLLIAGAGDEMQGIKKGVIELADALVINKADGDNLPRCRLAQAEMKRVLRYLQPVIAGWRPTALTASALTGEGVAETWTVVEKFFAQAQRDGGLDQRRREQAVSWLHALLEEGWRHRFYAKSGARERVAAMEDAVAEARLPTWTAVQRLLDGE